MPDLQPRRWSPILVLLVATASLASCGGNAGAETEADAGTEAETNPLDSDTDMPTTACLWETDELLARVGASEPELFDCGTFPGAQPPGDDCFTDNLAAGRAVQISINNCVDCLILSTYVATPSAGMFHLYREADLYGDDMRVVRVDSCTDFIVNDVAGAQCAGPVVRYSCNDPLPDPSDL